MRRLGDAATDPLVWPEVMDDICRAVGASAAVLFQSDVRTPDVPRTKSIEEGIQLYFADNWQNRDPRAGGFPQMMAGKVITDHDVLTPEQISSDPMYNEILFPFGFRWFAGVGFWADSAAWALTLQRTQGEGQFDERDKRLLARLAPRLTETASLATAVGRVAVSSMTNILGQVRQPALALDRLGTVVSFNEAAQSGFDDEIHVRDRQLRVRDKVAAVKLEKLLDFIRCTPHDDALPTKPILIRRTNKLPVVARVFPIDGAARNVFLQARVMLILTNLLPRPVPDASLISQAFGLTPAESRVAALLAAGNSLDAVAQSLRVSRETARIHLKSAFSKTGTHRQSELISLVSQLAG